MKILAGQQIMKAIERSRPTRVAVAYIGADWRKFIPDPSRLQYVIVSPTLGTNPMAVSNLVKAISWKRVFFLDELHAKIFSGRHSAVIGSANLTKNGLSGEGLIELSVEVSSAHALKKVSDELERFLARAKKIYGNSTKKQERLRRLFTLWGSAIANNVICEPTSSKTQFDQFQLLSNDQFYVCWYDDFGGQYSEPLKRRADDVEDEMHFASTDAVKTGRWILVWRITGENKPHRGSRPYWIYVHDVFNDGIVDRDYEYPKCAVQWKSKSVPPKPFEITRDFVEAFNKVIVDKRLAPTLLQDGRVWNLRTSHEGVPLLLRLLREELRQKM